MQLCLVQLRPSLKLVPQARGGTQRRHRIGDHGTQAKRTKVLLCVPLEKHGHAWRADQRQRLPPSAAVSSVGRIGRYFCNAR